MQNCKDKGKQKGKQAAKTGTVIPGKCADPSTEGATAAITEDLKEKLNTS